MGILLVELIIRFKAPGSVAAIALGLVAAGFAVFGIPSLDPSFYVLCECSKVICSEISLQQILI